MGIDHELTGVIIALIIAILINLRIFLHEYNRRKASSITLFVCSILSYFIYMIYTGDLIPFLSFWQTWVPLLTFEIIIGELVTITISRIIRSIMFKNHPQFQTTQTHSKKIKHWIEWNIRIFIKNTSSKKLMIMLKSLILNILNGIFSFISPRTLIITDKITCLTLFAE